jgi:hypothetical protein
VATAREVGGREHEHEHGSRRTPRGCRFRKTCPHRFRKSRSGRVRGASPSASKPLPRARVRQTLITTFTGPTLPFFIELAAPARGGAKGKNSET